MDEAQAKQEDSQENKEAPQQDEKPLNIVEEAKKVRDEIKAENDRRMKILEEERTLKANEMLAGTTGGRVEPKEAQEETAKDYMQKVMSGGLNGEARE